jgi:hypothetical protein
MKLFRIIFNGKKRDAIGSFYSFVEYIKGEDEKAAILRLYELYDHIHIMSIKEVK